MLYKIDKNNVRYEEAKRPKAPLIIGAILIISTTVGICQMFGSVPAYGPTQYQTVYNDSDTFNQENLIQMLKDLHVRFPSIVLAQSILETGHWTSKMYKVNHNLFGMREAYARIRTAQGTRYKHAYYSSWRESVYDYAFYQARYMNKAKTEEQYYAALEASYAENPAYVENLKKLVIRENLEKHFR